MIWPIVGWVCLALAAIISVGNFYLSFLRYPLYKFRGWDYHWVSALPIFGTVTLLIALGLLSSQPVVWWSAPLLAALDTGGLPWFCLIMFFAWLTGRR